MTFTKCFLKVKLPLFLTLAMTCKPCNKQQTLFTVVSIATHVKKKNHMKGLRTR